MGNVMPGLDRNVITLSLDEIEGTDEFEGVRLRVNFLAAMPLTNPEARPVNLNNTHSTE